MPTNLNRFTLSFTKAQLDELRLRFPGAPDDRSAIYLALGFDPPEAGGTRPGAGRPKKEEQAPKVKKRRGRPKKRK